MTELLAAANNLIVAAVSVIGAITAALIGGITIWTFRDIRSRTRDVLAQILATVMVGVVPIAGLIVYFLLRPRETLAEGYVRALEEESLLASIENQEFCPACGRRVDADMQFCPSCRETLRKGCPNCGRALHLSWDLCPYCGTGAAPAPEVSRPVRNAMPKPASPAIPAPQPEPTSGRVGTFFDRIGGAVEGVRERTRRGTAPDDVAPSTPPPPVVPPPPVARRAIPRAQPAPPRPPQPAPPRPPLEERLE